MCNNTWKVQVKSLFRPLK